MTLTWHSRSINDLDPLAKFICLSMANHIHMWSIFEKASFWEMTLTLSLLQGQLSWYPIKVHMDKMTLRPLSHAYLNYWLRYGSCKLGNSTSPVTLTFNPRSFILGIQGHLTQNYIWPKFDVNWFTHSKVIKCFIFGWNHHIFEVSYLNNPLKYQYQKFDCTRLVFWEYKTMITMSPSYVVLQL